MFDSRAMPRAEWTRFIDGFPARFSGRRELSNVCVCQEFFPRCFSPTEGTFVFPLHANLLFGLVH